MDYGDHGERWKGLFLWIYYATAAARTYSEVLTNVGYSNAGDSKE